MVSPGLVGSGCPSCAEGEETPGEQSRSSSNREGTPSETLKGIVTLREDGLERISLEGMRREDLRIPAQLRPGLRRMERDHVTNGRDSAAFANTPEGNITPREDAPGLVTYRWATGCCLHALKGKLGSRCGSAWVSIGSLPGVNLQWVGDLLGGECPLLPSRVGMRSVTLCS
jgi:hypothetical protein